MNLGRHSIRCRLKITPREGDGCERRLCLVVTDDIGTELMAFPPLIVGETGEAWVGPLYAVIMPGIGNNLAMHLVFNPDELEAHETR